MVSKLNRKIWNLWINSGTSLFEVDQILETSTFIQMRPRSLLPPLQLQPIDCSVYWSATPHQTGHPTPPKSKWTSLVRLTIIEGVEALAYGDHTLQPRPLVTPQGTEAASDRIILLMVSTAWGFPLRLGSRGAMGYRSIVHCCHRPIWSKQRM